MWTAADCNHDGTIDSLDVGLLNEAGIKLQNVNQSADEAELQSSSAYNDYLQIIDQTPDVPDEPAVMNPFFTVINTVVSFIIRIVTAIIDIFAGVL